MGDLAYYVSVIALSVSVVALSRAREADRGADDLSALVGDFRADGYPAVALPEIVSRVLRIAGVPHTFHIRDFDGEDAS